MARLSCSEPRRRGCPSQRPRTLTGTPEPRSGGRAGPVADLLRVAPPFQERYTCPSLALHPREPVFLAQTNGNYLALFSAVWPYRMSRRRRYEGHKVPVPVPMRREPSTSPRACSRTVSAADAGPRGALTLHPAGSVSASQVTTCCVAWCPLQAHPRPQVLAVWTGHGVGVSSSARFPPGPASLGGGGRRLSTGRTPSAVLGLFQQIP